MRCVAKEIMDEACEILLEFTPYNKFYLPKPVQLAGSRLLTF